MKLTLKLLPSSEPSNLGYAEESLLWIPNIPKKNWNSQYLYGIGENPIYVGDWVYATDGETEWISLMETDDDVNSITCIESWKIECSSDPRISSSFSLSFLFDYTLNLETKITIESSKVYLDDPFCNCVCHKEGMDVIHFMACCHPVIIDSPTLSESDTVIII